MKTYRQREKQGTKVTDTNKGPDEAKIKVRVKPLFWYTRHTNDDISAKQIRLNFIDPNVGNYTVAVLKKHYKVERK